MKILFIYNQAGVSSNLKKGLKKFYIESKIISNSNKFNFLDTNTYNDRAKIFELRILKESLNYDIIHINGFPFKEFDFKLILKALKLKNKKLILHLHGTEIRTKHKIINKFINYFDLILYSTPDLKSYIQNSVYLPTPINTQIFYNRFKIRSPKLLYIKKIYEDSKDISRWCFKKSYPYDILEKNFNYMDMPKLLNIYKYYFDQYTFKALSKTALEALFCECKVINNFMSVENYDIEKHDYTNVTKIYLDLIKKMFNNE